MTEETLRTGLDEDASSQGAGSEAPEHRVETEPEDRPLPDEAGWEKGQPMAGWEKGHPIIRR